MLSVGAARWPIATSAGDPLAGYPPVHPYHGGPQDHRGYTPRTERAVGVHDTIYARAVVLSKGSRTVSIIALDVCLVSPALTARIKQECARSVDVDSNALILLATHTHSGPDYCGYWQEADASLEDHVVAAALSALRAAAVSRCSARLGWGEGSLTAPVINRWDPTRSIDHRVSVLCIESEAGHPLAALFVWACHPIVLGPENLLVSRDFPGYAVDLVEHELGPHAVALFANGAAGDLNPRAFPYERGNISALAKRFSLEGRMVDFRSQIDAQRLGEVLGREVVRVGRITPTSASDELVFECANVDLPLKDERGLMLSWEHVPILPKHRSRFQTADTASTVVHGVRVANASLVCLPGEPFVEVGITLQDESQRFGSTPMRVLGYANDYLGYICPIADYEHSRYETVTTPLSAAGAEALIDAARRVSRTLGS